MTALTTPVYSLKINTTIVLHKHRRNVIMQRSRYLPFVPVENTIIRLTNDDNEVMDVQFVNLVYDVMGGFFLEEHEDRTLIDELREDNGPELTVTQQRLQEYIDYYKSFGWEIFCGATQKAT